ncbi:MAG: hypothetical protein MUF75_02895 [Bacteroidia bacterium]|jgi:hypothetical protein|nr:hypothetical protein [Bacteroidia bacterium]
MKKITLLALLAFGLSFASCKKDRTCTCTETSTTTITGGAFPGTYPTSQVTTTTLKEVNGKSARANCLSLETSQAGGSDGTGGTVNYTYKADCKLD